MNCEIEKDLVKTDAPPLPSSLNDENSYMYVVLIHLS